MFTAQNAVDADWTKCDIQIAALKMLVGVMTLKMAGASQRGLTTELLTR